MRSNYRSELPRNSLMLWYVCIFAWFCHGLGMGVGLTLTNIITSPEIPARGGESESGKGLVMAPFSHSSPRRGFPIFLLLSCQATWRLPAPSSSDLSLNPSSCCCLPPPARLPSFLPSVFHACLCVLHCDVTFSDEMAAVVTYVAAQSTTPKRRPTTPLSSSSSSSSSSSIPCVAQSQRIPHFVFSSRFMFPFGNVVRPSLSRGRCGVTVRQHGGLIFFRLGVASCTAGRPVANAGTATATAAAAVCSR